MLELFDLSAERAAHSRELVVLGTSAQVPTRTRNHNGYLLRWNGEGVLFDPGEGTQRQLLLAGISSSAISAICLTHFHGDHCLGLPGVLARFALDQRERPVDIYYPESGHEQLERLRHAAAFEAWPGVRLHPLPLEATELTIAGLPARAVPLRHRIDVLGWRIEEPDRHHLLPDRLERLGIYGPDRARLLAAGRIQTPHGVVRLEEVSELRSGPRFAFVMDTARCDGAVALADGADLVVCESTYLDDEADLAEAYGHLTARQAAWIAREAGARALVLTHFSQRHPDEACFAREAAEVFPEVVAARDLTAVPVPGRDA